MPHNHIFHSIRNCMNETCIGCEAGVPGQSKKSHHDYVTAAKI